MTEKATFAAGCFWGVEELFTRTPGVLATRVGFTGGSVPNPTYKRVCGGDTGYAEAVEVTYDPAKVSYRELLKIFWKNHDPTMQNRQGPDVGEQYRSAVFYHSDMQRNEAEKMKKDFDASGTYGRSIVTVIVPAVEFYEAEEYHQKYFQKQRNQRG